MRYVVTIQAKGNREALEEALLEMGFHPVMRSGEHWYNLPTGTYAGETDLLTEQLADHIEEVCKRLSLEVRSLIVLVCGRVVVRSERID